MRKRASNVRAIFNQFFFFVIIALFALQLFKVHYMVRLIKFNSCIQRCTDNIYIKLFPDTSIIRYFLCNTTLTLFNIQFTPFELINGTRAIRDCTIINLF